MPIWLVQVVHRLKRAVRLRANKGDSLPCGAEQLKTAVAAAPERAGERVVINECVGERGGNDSEGIGGVVARGGAGVGPDVAECDVEVAVCIEMGEREDMVVLEGWAGGEDESGLRIVNFHGW